MMYYKTVKTLFLNGRKNGEADNIVFAITVEDIQNEALEKIGRYLTEEEIFIAKKGLENGLLFDIGTVYDAIFYEMI
ncbi:MAG TPA: hypothetical protein VEC36_02780 [Patescibacteria group bacterium]|nr:hypothetical protein [Patescibacteria group bacterium]